MALITKIKAGSVSSLSDARYFAGMGVDWLGFDVNPKSESYVSPELYKIITGWVAGPKRLAEISVNEGLILSDIINEYSPDGFQFHYELLPDWKPNDLPAFVSVHIEDYRLSELPNLNNKADYLVLDLGVRDPFESLEFLTTLSRSIKILLSVEPQIKNAQRMVTELPIEGLALKGSKELKTGLKEYDYSELLEALEG